MYVGEQTRNGSQPLAVSTILAASARTECSWPHLPLQPTRSPRRSRIRSILRYSPLLVTRRTFLVIHRNLNVSFFSSFYLKPLRFLLTIRVFSIYLMNFLLKTISRMYFNILCIFALYKEGKFVRMLKQRCILGLSGQVSRVFHPFYFCLLFLFFAPYLISIFNNSFNRSNFVQ